MILEVLAIYQRLTFHSFSEKESWQILSGTLCCGVKVNENLGLQDFVFQPLAQHVPGKNEFGWIP